MKNSTIRLGATSAVLGGLVLAMSVGAFRAKADVWDKKTVLTIHQPIQVEETYLEPGTYVFKLLNSPSDRHIVQIFNEQQNHLINTVMAIPNYRLEPTGDTRFTFYETPPGTARAMHAWFYPGDNYGQEFRYPKSVRQIAAVTTTTTVVTDNRPPEPPPPPIVTQAPETTLQERAEVIEREEVHREEPVEIAQNNPPPAPPPVVTPAPEPAAAVPAPVEPAPAELPKTGTSYPLFGLLGLTSLAGYAILRVKRSS